MLSMTLTAASTAGMAWLVKPLLDYVFVDRDLALLNGLTLLVFLVYGATGVFSFFQSYFMNKVGYTIVNDLRVKLYAHVERQSLRFFHQHSSGELISRVVNDVSLIQSSVTQVVTGLVMDSCKVAGLLFVLFSREPLLAFLGILALPFAVLPIARFGRRLRLLATGGQLIMGSLISVLTETFQGARMVQSHNMTEKEIARFAVECRENVDNLMRAVTVKSLSSSVMEIVGGVCVAAVVWYGGSAVILGDSTPGTFFSFLTAILLLYEPLKRLTRIHNEAQQGLSAARRVFATLDEPPSIQNPPEPVTLAKVRGEIEFRQVSFAYEPGRPALQDVNLKIGPGETLALVGPSGGGKTSLANLLPRFYDPDRGEVLLDGVPIARLDLPFLRSQIALVSQEVTLFNDTARNNIAYGKPEATDEEVRRAARDALAHDFIMALPEGYSENIGEKGGKLSGGQRQRIAIARAILKDSPILILDEATSSLDAESEKYVQMALENLMSRRTTLLIAHRLSTTDKATRVAVVKGGRVVEEGERAALLRAKGEYYRMRRAQFWETEAESGGAGAPEPGEDI
jgi:subfamily B ATP-binding cassette protein MsbA